MSKILDSWGSHLNEQALLLLQKAEAVAQTQGSAINILHIVFIALTNTALATHQTITSKVKPEALTDLVYDIQQKMEDTSPYLDLDTYRIPCIEMAREQSIQISDALILVELLEKSYTIEQLFLSRNVALHELKTSIQEQIDTTPKKIPTGPLLYLPSSAGMPEDEDIKELLRAVTTPVPVIPSEPLLANIDDARHSITLNTLLRTMEDILREGREQFIMVCGQNGSVIDMLEPVLAYRLGHMRPLDVLHGYTLWKISFNALLDLYSRNHLLHPAVSLKLLKQEAVAAKAILLLTGLEAFAPKSGISRQIRAQLRSPDGACIVGCYTWYEKPPEEKVAKLGMDNVRLVTPEQISERTTLYDLIKDYHIPRWEAGGYTIDEDVFDSLLTLERGVWIDKQRKTFPYLAIGLVDDCIHTLRHNELHIRNMARDALVALSKLLKEEEPQASEKDRRLFHNLLVKAQEHVYDLFAMTEIKQRQGKKVITQALIETQLFCRNNSEFHFPGFLPWSIPVKRQKEY